jgi:hypothetical protein
MSLLDLFLLLDQTIDFFEPIEELFHLAVEFVELVVELAEELLELHFALQVLPVFYF